jgi:hypothetical protein
MWEAERRRTPVVERPTDAIPTALEGEERLASVRRLAGLVCETGARVILRPIVFPQMRDLWHELTT